MELEREQRKLLVLRERAHRAEQAWRATPHARRSARLRAEMRWRLAADDRQRQQAVVDRLLAADLVPAVTGWPEPGAAPAVAARAL